VTNDEEVARLLGIIAELKRLPVMDMCNRCDDCIPLDHDTGEAACTHPALGLERPVVANASPPDWCPLRGKA